jgi:hypothetical protein
MIDAITADTLSLSTASAIFPTKPVEIFFAIVLVTLGHHSLDRARDILACHRGLRVDARQNLIESFVHRKFPSCGTLPERILNPRRRSRTSQEGPRRARFPGATIPARSD